MLYGNDCGGDFLSWEINVGNVRQSFCDLKLMYAIYKTKALAIELKKMFVMHISSNFYKFTRNKYIKYPIGYRKNI